MWKASGGLGYIDIYIYIFMKQKIIHNKSSTPLQQQENLMVTDSPVISWEKGY